MNSIIGYFFPGSDPVRRRPLQHILDLIYFALFFVTPILISTGMKQVFNSPKYLFVGILAVLAVAVWLIEALHRRELTVPRAPTILFFTLLMVWEALTMLRSTGIDLSIREYGVQLSLYLLFLVAACCIRDKERIENLLHFAIAAGVVAAGFGVLQYYQLDEIIFRRMTFWFVDLSYLILPQKPEEQLKVYSFMGHRNYLAGYLICVLPVVLSRLVSSLAIAGSRGRYASLGLRQSAVYGASFFLMFGVVVLTHTRGSWVGLTVGILTFLAILALKFRALAVWRPLVAVLVGMATLAVTLGARTLPLGVVGGLGVAGAGLALSILACRGRSLGVAMAVVAACALLTGGVLSLSGATTNPLNRMHASALDRFADSFDLRQGSAFQRVLIWRTAWKIITDGPWNFLVGTGFGTFGLNYMPYQARLLENPALAHYIPEINKSIYAHSEYLHFWSEIGLLGILLMAATAFTFCRAMAGYVARSEVTYQNLLLVGMFCSTVGVLAHNVFSFSLHLPYTSSLFYCLVAFCLRYEGAPDLRLTWGRREGEATEQVPVDGGSVVLSILPLTGGRFRAFAGWHQTPAHAADRELTLSLEGPGAKSAVVEKMLPPPGGDALVLERKASTAGWCLRLAEGGTVLGEAAVARRSSVDPGLASLLAWGGTVMLALLASVVMVAIVDCGLVDVWWRDAFLKFRVRRFDESIIDYTKALRFDPNRGEVLFDFGRSLMDSGRNMMAVTKFEKAKGNFVDPANDHNIALCYYKDRREDKAEEHYRRALALNPIYEQSLANYGFYLVGQNRLDEARSLLERGVKYYPKNASFSASLGVLEARAEHFDEAEKLLRKAVALDPTVTSAKVNLATILFNKGEIDQARALYEDLLKERPNDALVQRKYLGAASAAYRARLQRNPDDLEAAKGLGVTLERLGAADPRQQPEAVAVLRAYLMRRPDDGEARFHLAAALQTQGFLGEALSNFRAALAFIEAGNPLREQVMDRIRVLEIKVADEGAVRQPPPPTTAPRPGVEAPDPDILQFDGPR